MMVRYSEIRAKRDEMARESDPRSDFVDETERQQRDEMEVRRELDEVDIRQKDSVDGQPREPRLRRSEKGP